MKTVDSTILLVQGNQQRYRMASIVGDGLEVEDQTRSFFRGCPLISLFCLDTRKG